MNKKTAAVLILLLTFLVNTALAQPRSTGWLASFNTIKINSRFSIHSDFQLRSSDEYKMAQTLLLRAGLNVSLTKQLTATAGYAHIKNYRLVNGENRNAPEQRAWEQLLFTHKLKSIFVSHRLRMEQRFISANIVPDGQWKNNGTLYASRLRYFVRGILPLKKQETFKQGVFAALQNEFFVNLGDKSNVNGETFDQNRLYFAVGYRASKSFDVEAGYLNQYVNGKGSAFVNNHVIQLATYLRL